MKSTLLLLAVAGAALLSVASADASNAQKQHDVNFLLWKVNEHLRDEKHKEYAKTFDPEADKSHYSDNGEAVHRLMKELKDNRLLQQKHWFSLFNDRHREEAIMLFDVFMHCKDWETAVKNAAYFRDRMNEGEFVYAVYAAVIHHPLAEHVVLPPLYEVTPHMFTNTEVIQEAYAAKMRQTPTKIKSSFTGTARNKEQRVAYFGEDIGMNTHHVFWHLEFPFWWKDSYSHKLDRKGENFYWIHNQLTVRFDAERISNYLEPVEELHWDKPIHDGFAPHTSYKYGGAFPSRPDDIDFEDVDGVARVRDMIIIESRIRDAIAHGYIIKEDGSHIDIMNDRGADVLGDVIESSLYSPNAQYYGALHNTAHIMLGRQTDPHGKYNMPPGVMEHFETATRDPGFFRLHKYMDNIFREHKDSLPSYTFDELDFKGVSVTNVAIDGTLETYFEDFEYSLLNAVDDTEEIADVDIDTYVPRLDHKEFSYNIDINNEKGSETLATIRIFAWPHKDNNGVEFSFDDGRWQAIELDKFWVKLSPGSNNIVRKSTDSSVTVHDVPSFKTLMEKTEAALSSGGDLDLHDYESATGLPRGRGRGGGHRGGRPDYYHGRRKSRSPPPRQRHDHGKLLANLGPEAQLALTTALINSVLKTDGRDGRGMYRDRDRHRDGRREGRGGYFREESRERRHYGDERRSHEPRPYHEEGRGHRYEREKSASGSPRYRNNRYSGMARRKPSPHAHHGPSRKRQRLERMDSGESGSSPHHDREYEGDDSYDQERERDRQKERRHRSPGSEDSRKGREGEGGEGANDKEEGGDGPSGVQVTIKADGERAVNSEGHVRARVSGRLFVELRCPHCPSQKSITFKEYKFHLGSEGHKNQLNRLARKHSVVLRKIRVQQRQEQRDIEEKWKEEKAEEFKNAVSKFCTTCKLAYKCLGSNVSDGLSLHNRSKFHRMQRHYLHPRCSMCRITFPSRMVYEYHIASISHLRVRTAKIDNNGGEGRSDEQDQEDDDDVLDLANFMTLDSVGEDDEEVGSEHEEITEGLDEVEAAEEGSMRKKSSKGRKCGMGRDNDEISIDADWEKDNLEEDDDETEPVGMDYVTRVEAYYCSLCCKYIRGDTSLGSRCVQRHCRSFDHLAHYQDAHPPPAEEEEDADAVEKKSKSESGVGDESAEGKSYRRREEGGSEGEEGDYEGEGDYEEEEEEEEDHDDDPEQEKLWEEVDQGLAALQGEIMNENGDKANLAAGRSKDAEKEHNKNGDAEAREDSGDEDGKMEIAEREESDNDSANEEEAEMTDENKEDAEYDAKASERENELEERQEEDIESGSDGD